LADGMELVLLIEDFVVLSGLQGQLLQVMVQEAMRDGRQVRCTMRAAIAYTPGYLHTDTVLSRAGYEYRIEDLDADEAATQGRIRGWSTTRGLSSTTSSFESCSNEAPLLRGCSRSPRSDRRPPRPWHPAWPNGSSVLSLLPIARDTCRS